MRERKKYHQGPEKKMQGASAASRRFFGHTVFMNLRIGYFSDTQEPSMVVAEDPKIFDV